MVLIFLSGLPGKFREIGFNAERAGCCSGSMGSVRAQWRKIVELNNLLKSVWSGY